MSLPVTYRPAAQAEYAEAAEWYEGQTPGLGARFEATVQGVIDQIAADPTRYATEHKDVRGAQVPVFPYCVYYRVRSGRVVIISVFHTSRDPAVWQSRA